VSREGDRVCGFPLVDRSIVVFFHWLVLQFVRPSVNTQNSEAYCFIRISVSECLVLREMDRRNGIVSRAE
jgi:hypothetical protein